MKRLLLFALLFTFILSSCFYWGKKPYTGDPLMQKVWGWKPVYALDTSYRVVAFKEAQPVVTPGKIYVKDNYIFQCEVGKGIHVIDNTNPKTAHRIGFIEVKGCEEISIKGDYLYTNNYFDLVTIDLHSPQQVKIVNRIPYVFYASATGQFHTWQEPTDTGWFDCSHYYTDSTIVSWKQDSIYPYCRKN